MNRELPADLLGAVCPTPIFNHKQIVLGHGSGGKLTSDLIQKFSCRLLLTITSRGSMTRPFYNSTGRGSRSPPMPSS